MISVSYSHFNYFVFMSIFLSHSHVVFPQPSCLSLDVGLCSDTIDTSATVEDAATTSTDNSRCVLFLMIVNSIFHLLISAYAAYAY